MYEQQHMCIYMFQVKLARMPTYSQQGAAATATANAVDDKIFLLRFPCFTNKLPYWRKLNSSLLLQILFTSLHFSNIHREVCARSLPPLHQMPRLVASFELVLPLITSMVF